MASAAAGLPLGTPDPALTRLFTPLAVPPGTYVVYTSTETIETLTARLRAQDPSPAPGAWKPSRPEAHGAFGQEGPYDRARLARLFNGKRVTVVRGSLLQDGQRLAYTLVSPYPDADAVPHRRGDDGDRVPGAAAGVTRSLAAWPPRTRPLDLPIGFRNS